MTPAIHAHCHPLQPFVYTDFACTFGPDGDCREERTAQERKVYCSGSGKACWCDDRLNIREFDFVPLWNIPVRFEYQMR
jgi:hypothetical protein